MNEDSELLRRYAEHCDEAAFETLVQRHVNLVFAAALRQMGGDAQAAEDVAQIVFADLARKAEMLARRGGITGWLYTSTRFAAAKMRRAGQRRRTREHEATQMNATPGNEDTHSHWQELAPVLDEAMHDLKAQDREALLLRYFQDSDFKSMGTALGLSEGAAQMRVSRTLERLRRALARRGIAISATALSATLGSDAVISAPAGLAASAASTALASAATDSGSALSLIKLMTMTKLKAGVIAAIAVAGVATPLAVQHQTQVKLREENQSLRQQARELDQLKTENGRLSNLLAQANGSQLSKEQLSELMKLRGEVGLLRRQTNEQGKLLATTGALNPSTNEVKPDAVNPQIIPRESWAFVGYSTPEDALQSIAWAMSKGDVKKFLASLSPATQRAYAQRFEGKTEDEMAAMLQDEIRGLPALRLDRKKGSGDGELAFILYSKEFYDGTTRTKDEAVMTFMDIGGEWKLHEPNQSATNVSPSDAAR